MRIVNVTTGDTGNQSYLLSKAINEHTRHASRSFIRQTYYEWPHDVMWRSEWQGSIPAWIQAYWATADVVHLHNRWQRAKYWAEAPKAAWIVHQHGQWPDRDRYELELDVDRERGAIRVVSTINLLSDVGWRFDRWFPRPIEIALPVRTHTRKPIHVIQCPTVIGAKQTGTFRAVVAELEQDYEITYEVVTRRPHSECLIRKARADILFDQLSPSFGTNALEAWAMGIPVICGVDDETDAFFADQLGVRPYVRACTRSELKEALEHLITDPSYRIHMATLGNEYVRKWHAPKRCAEIAIRTYKEGIEQ